MTTTNISNGGKHSKVALGVSIIALASLTIWFIIGRTHYFTNFTSASYTAYYWPRRFGLVAHLVGGTTAIFTGLVQIWLGLNGRTRVLHRTLGKIYAIGVLLGGAGAIYMALTIPNGLAYATGLFFLGVAWLVTTGMAIFSIWRRRIEQHRDWMLRSYTVTFAFVTFRLAEMIVRSLVKFPENSHVDDLDSLLTWACWAVPLLLLEPLLQFRHLRARH